MTGGGSARGGQAACADAGDSRRGPFQQHANDSDYYPAKLYHVPAYWRWIAAVMMLAVLPALASSRVLPGLAVALPALAAMLLAVAAPIFIKLEREIARTAPERVAVMLGAVLLPMLLYGAAAAAWARQQQEPLWIGAVGMAALVGSASAILLARRSAGMLTAMGAIWLPLIAASGNRDVWLIFAAGVAGGTLMVVRQTRIYRAAMAKRRSRERVQARALDILVDYEKTGRGWFWETDCSGAISYASPGVARVLGRAADALLGESFTALFAAEAGHDSGQGALEFHLAARLTFQDVAVRAAEANDERWWAISGSPIYDGRGEYLGYRGFGADHTEKRRSQERASRLAHSDSLTGLANRFQMSQWLETILNAPHEEHRRCAILLIDLDRFKLVNDTLGHPAGDALLKQVAERLRSVVGPTGRIGRLGGDEFQVILPGERGREELAGLAERLVAALSEPFALDGQRASIGASLGIVLAPADGVTSDALIRNADLALYAAKAAGRSGFRFYLPELHSNAEERCRLERDLREAIASGGLELWYQPVVHTVSETIVGFEALLRWNHPQLGRLSPAKFVPIAEDAGLIAPIGEWALRTACRDLASWPEAVRVSVNLSPLQFANPALPAIVTSALAAAQVSPSRLELEITESVFLSEDSSTEAMFTALKRLGVRLALDDFGTGYSSLGYLESAPFDRIKIDQSFVRGATAHGSRNGAILASIVNLAEALGMDTTAEGVETEEELELVRMLGCSHVQGYVYEAPMSLADTVARLTMGLETRMSDAPKPRTPRFSVLRKVVVEHGGDRHDALVRNISISGAMIEVPQRLQPGTAVDLHVAEGQVIAATARWCEDNRLGLEFVTPFMLDTHGRIPAPLPLVEEVRRTA